jgi:hypothetical protein
MDINQKIAIRSANSMEIFADGKESFNYGEWKAWKSGNYGHPEYEISFGTRGEMACKGKRKMFESSIEVNDYLANLWSNMPFNACKGKGKKGGKGKK